MSKQKVWLCSGERLCCCVVKCENNKFNNNNFVKQKVFAFYSAEDK